jgi:lysine-specific demethylase 3
MQDWPIDADFKDKFPQLYRDFSQALPVPDFTRRDGALNIASHVRHFRAVLPMPSMFTS